MTKNKLPFLEWVFILFFAFICLNPKMNALISMPIFLSLELIYILYIIVVESRLRAFVVGLITCSMVIAMMYVFTTASVYIGQDAAYRELKSFVAIFFSYLSLCFPILMTYRLLLYGSAFQKKSILVILMTLLALIFYVTWGELSVNERIMKARMSSSLDDDGNALVGGYTFICACAVLLSSVFYAFRLCDHKILRLGLLLITCFLLFFIIRSLYTIALIAGVLGMLATIRIKNMRFFVPVIIALPYFFPLLLQWIINILGEGDIKYRMMEIHSLLITGTLGEGDLAARMKLYGRGLVAFCSSPLWGNYSLGFNPHSTIIELLASVGLLGFVPFVIILKKTFRQVQNIQPQWSIASVFIAFLFMAMTNPIHASLPLNITMWLFVPLLYDNVSLLNAKESYKPRRKYKVPNV